MGNGIDERADGMTSVIAAAQAIGASDKDIEAWLDKPLSGWSRTPREMIDEGRTADVLDALAAMDEGVFG